MLHVQFVNGITLNAEFNIKQSHEIGACTFIP